MTDPIKNFYQYLQGGDLRSIARVDELIRLVNDQNNFDKLLEYLYDDDRLIVMRAADAIEKITKAHPEYLEPHKLDLIRFLDVAQDKELKWHLALLMARITPSQTELMHIWVILSKWALDKKESKIVRANSLEALFHLSKQNIRLEKSLITLIKTLENQNIPSMNARIRKLKKFTQLKKGTE